jgi:EcoRII C terminal.
MKVGYLSQYFTGVAVKNLSAVEADIFKSNQHEFNGAEALKKLFGEAKGKVRFDARFLYMDDIKDEPVTADGYLTWYDAREKHPTRSEHRLYFPTNAVSDLASEDDLLIIGLRPDNSVLVIITEKDSTIGNQMQWLFGFVDLTHPYFSVRGGLESEKDRIEFTSRIILEQIGIETKDYADAYLEDMIKRFGGVFPPTTVFSAYARSTLKNINAFDDPDIALLSWLEREELLFRTLERHLIADRLSKGFEVDDFLSLSLSVQNRRKSRVGYALENHVEEIFLTHKIRYDRTRITENKSKPDFIFPGIDNYHDTSYDTSLLTMLGVKSTCKDRWRQVLAEADRIEKKHLLTLETAISENQTNEMRDRNLQLVLPQKLIATYTPRQQSFIINIAVFIRLVQEKQASAVEFNCKP